jgi:uncharacterized protein (TIGR02118 family)
MSDAYIAFFRRPAGETPESFGQWVRATAADLAARPDASTVVAFVDDGSVGAPPAATFGPSAYVRPSRYDGGLLTAGLPRGDLPDAEAIYRIRRRVVKARARGRDGARSTGFTYVFPVNRANHINHEQFDVHWRDVHSRVHVQASPGTRHYEQLIIDECLTPGAAPWDGVSLLSFGSHEDFTERRYRPGGGEAIAADVKKFVASPTETLATSEFVYLDDASESMYRDDGT